MKKLFFVPLLLCLILISLEANTLSIDYIKKQPSGVSRDFYIWLYLQQNITPKEAEQAYNLASRKNSALKKAYRNKINKNMLTHKTICSEMDLNTLIKQDNECIANGLTLRKAQKLDSQTILKLSKNLAKTHATLSQNLSILASKTPFPKLIQTNAENFANFYFGVDQNYRKKLNHAIPKEILKNYLQTKNQSLQKALRHAIMSPRQMNHFNSSLTEIDPNEILPYLNGETSFYLGLNAANHNLKEKAILFFNHSTKNAKDLFHKNRGNFWSFLISKDDKYLKELVQSPKIDIYALAAIEASKSTPRFKIIRELKVENNIANWNTSNPFEWEKIKESYKKGKNKEQLLQKVKHINTEPHYAWLRKATLKNNEEYFLTPYKDVFSVFSIDKQALLYAIGRQESLFIPTAISTSYALGLMQLMPFNVKAISKTLGESDKIDYQDMFDPAINVPYAEYFTRPLIKEFKHPLFVFYAYNAGPGFTRRLLGQKYLFRNENPLDPWYSMEMIPYEEARTYGKKVLVNYVIYQQGFGKDIKLLDLIYKARF